jgi:hypothetical protein
MKCVHKTGEMGGAVGAKMDSPEEKEAPHACIGDDD